MRRVLGKSIISLIILCSWVAAVPAATTADLAAGAPDRYVVVRGDTLWSIARRFLKQPWRWGELWNMNRQQIRNPHRIYPGNVIVLDRSGAQLRLRVLKGDTDRRSGDRGGQTDDFDRRSSRTVKLSPQVLITPLASESVPTIPIAVIEPFLGKPLVIAQNQLASAPRIVRTQENRVNLSAGDIAYVQGITKDQGSYWHLFRPGAAMIDPDTSETLGYEAIFLGEAKLIRYGEAVSTLEVVKSPLEIHTGDYLLPAPSDVSLESYVPRAPEKKIEARIISAYSGLDEIGSLSIVAINKGARDGLEAGHVLAIYRDLNATSPNRLRESSLFGRTGPVYDKNNPNTRYVNEPLATRGSPLYGRVGPFGFQYRDHETKSIAAASVPYRSSQSDLTLVFGAETVKAGNLPLLPLPDERYGLLMVFRVFDRASYALIMNSDRPVNVLDTATNP